MTTLNQFSWRRFLVLLGGALVFFAIFAYLYKSAPQSTDNGSQTANLDAEASFSPRGLTITNKDSVVWTGCEVGINGSCTADIQDPPYQTHQAIVVGIGQSTTIPYSSLTASDGTLFDIATHAVNSIVIMCSMGTLNQVQRTYCGAR